MYVLNLWFSFGLLERFSVLSFPGQCEPAAFMIFFFSFLEEGRTSCGPLGTYNFIWFSLCTDLFWHPIHFYFTDVFWTSKIMTDLFLVSLRVGKKKISLNWYPARDQECCIHHKMNTSSGKTKRKTFKRYSLKIVVLDIYIWGDFKAQTSIRQCVYYASVSTSPLSITPSPPQSFFFSWPNISQYHMTISICTSWISFFFCIKNWTASDTISSYLLSKVPLMCKVHLPSWNKLEMFTFCVLI